MPSSVRRTNRNRPHIPSMHYQCQRASTPDDDTSRSAKLLARASKHISLNVVRSDPSGSLSRHPWPTVEARFSGRLGGVEDLFHTSSAFRIVSLVCA